MSGKEVLKVLLLNYGFENIEVNTYRGDFNSIGYEVSANRGDIHYHEIDCEGFMFHVYQITKYMHIQGIYPVITNRADQSMKDFINDNTRL